MPILDKLRDLKEKTSNGHIFINIPDEKEPDEYRDYKNLRKYCFTIENDEKYSISLLGKESLKLNKIINTNFLRNRIPLENILSMVSRSMMINIWGRTCQTSIRSLATFLNDNTQFQDFNCTFKILIFDIEKFFSEIKEKIDISQEDLKPYEYFRDNNMPIEGLWTIFKSILIDTKNLDKIIESLGSNINLEIRQSCILPQISLLMIEDKLENRTQIEFLDPNQSKEDHPVMIAYYRQGHRNTLGITEFYKKAFNNAWKNSVPLLPI